MNQNGMIPNLGQAAAMKGQALANNRLVLLNLAVQLIGRSAAHKSVSEIYHDVVLMAEKLGQYVERG